MRVLTPIGALVLGLLMLVAAMSLAAIVPVPHDVTQVPGPSEGPPAESGPWALDESQTCGVDAPADGTWSLDAGFPYGTTTKICISETTVAGLQLGSFMSKFTDQDGLFIQSSTDPADQALFDITGAPIDQGAFYEFPVSLDNRVGQKFKDGERQIFASQQPSSGTANVFMAQMYGSGGTDGYVKWWAGDGSKSGDSVCPGAIGMSCKDAFNAMIPAMPVACTDTPASGLHFALCGK